MSDKKINFDEIVDRRRTDSIKYDFAKQRGMPEDVMPLWVADMDFKVSDQIIEAIQKRTSHGIFGYTEVGDGYFEALQGWMEKKYHWNIDRRWLVKTPGVVYALAMAIQAFTEPGDAVMIQQPVYYPFRETIEINDRKLVDNTLYLGDDGRYHMDLEDFERKVEENGVKLFILCSPHNPVGRVWSKEELEKLGEICVRKNILVVSDEIHQDFVFRGEHTVFANLNKEIQDRTITCTSPSKTFNLAGLQISNILISNPQLRHRFKEQIVKSGYSQLNTLGLTACEAAYRYGEEWYTQLIEYLKGNIEFVRNFLEERIPQIKMLEPEGTYLVWLDFRGLSLSEKEKEDLVIHKARLWLDKGTMFGEPGVGFERINIACPRAILQQALEKLEAAM
ncbi:MalY/PatB family protein [Kineothrix sp. MB12-C1]|uniref:MalY/PatB family protein n=1 Tax=Kineothrix sp. MB12-C1 TaxID=3070215 RepID=UPI0027D2520F|nr:MalY/PatB family protein [Kineothrix sp. MB12-C1]WMC93279.1 MalY/PatB family protein [Kineothrix sp. MB12-C1]